MKLKRTLIPLVLGLTGFGGFFLLMDTGLMSMQGLSLIFEK